MKRVAIAVVTYNSADVVGKCLDAVNAAAGDLADCIVVDNASCDATREEVGRRPWARLIANSENRGFAAAVNQAVLAGNDPYILLLNPDTELQGGMEALLAACERGAAAAGGKLIGVDGEAQAGFAVRRLPTAAALAFEALGLNRLFPGNPVNRRYRCLDWDLNRAAEAEQPAGAFLMFRRDAWQAVGGFDESFYPLWFEDVDFCRRLRDRNLAVRYEPGAVALHSGGHSIRSIGWDRRQLYWYGSLLRYTAKHFRRVDSITVYAAVGAGAIFRGIVGLLVSEKRLETVLVYGKVVRLAWRYLLAGFVKRAAQTHIA
jgi:N-acetylglucosaminyl-diphospho-decaprenol L-rhamnosyltransferase